MGETPSGGMVPRVIVLGKISNWHPHSDYSGLGVSLQLEWQYLQRTVTGVCTLMSTIEEALRDLLPRAIWGGVGQRQLSENPRT